MFVSRRGLIGLFGALVWLTACSGGGEEPTGSSVSSAGSGGSTAAGTGGSTSTTSEASSGAGGGSSSSGAGGGQGGGGPLVATTDAVGSPKWMPMDFHLFVAKESSNDDFFAVMQSILKPPNHTIHPMLGLGPGAPHMGFNDEMKLGVEAAHYKEDTAFKATEINGPDGLYLAFMTVPTAGAPTGVSPDFASGPIIPNDIFPMHVSAHVLENGSHADNVSVSFDVPALDGKLNPPFNVDGHSHIPLFFAYRLPSMLDPDVAGSREWSLQMIDATGSGWNITVPYEVK